MLTPNEVLVLSEPVEDMYADCASQLTINIAKHFTLDELSTAQEWRIRRLAEMGQLTRETVRIIARTTGQSEETIRATMEKAAGMSLADLEKLMEQAAKAGKVAPAGELFASSRVRSVLDAMTANAQNSMNLVNTTMLRSTLDSYRAAINQVFSLEEAQAILNSAAGSVALSVEARRDAVRSAIKKLADKGITGYVDKAGRHWTPEAYVNMVVRTTVHNASIEVEKERAADYGVNTFQISLKTPARPLCAPYIGWICSWDGTTGTFTDLYGREYTLHSIYETSYGEPAGIFGINCGHDPITVVDGYSIIRDEPLNPGQQKKNAEVYQQTQTMRSLERDVRKLKTEALAYNAAGDKEAFDKTALRIKNKTDQYKAYCASNGLRERLDKLQVVGYNRSVSSAVTQAIKFNETIDGTVTADGIRIKSTAHLYGQARRRGVSAGAIVDSLKNPLDIKPVKYDDKGRPSKEYVGELATTAVNPHNGNATTTHKTHTKLVNGLKGGQK